MYATVAARERLLGQLYALAGSLLPRPGLAMTIVTATHEGSDWREVWKQFYHPMVLGQGAVLVRPSWIERRPDDPPLEVVLDPGQAFGTGLHETTRLCVGALAELRNRRPNEAPLTIEHVLDLGTGSGILGLCAARLFPTALVCCIDNDPVATEAAAENVATNQLTERIDVRTGTLPDADPGPFDLVIANIRPDVLIPIAADLTRRCTSTTVAVLSGILDEEHDRVAQAYVAQGWRVVADPTEGDWRALVLDRHPLP